MSRWEKNVRKAIPYIPGEQPKERDVIKLNTNENPYPPAPGVRDAIAASRYEEYRLYPDPEALSLVEGIAAYYHKKKEQVFVGVGSDDVLALAFLTFFNSDKPILFPDITYSFYEVWGDIYHVPYKKQPLNEEFQIVASDYMVDNGGIIFPNPNAPTGNLESVATIEKILQANPESVVIIDEAYIDFGGESCMPLIETYDNLLVVQTFSKSRAMAGLRIGFAVGCEKLIRYLNDAKFSINSYTMNRPVLSYGVEALKDNAYFLEITNKIIKTRERVKKELQNLGFSFPDSYGNFIFATHHHVPAREIFEALKHARIYVRYFNKPRIDNFLRITIGTDEEMDTLLAFLKAYFYKI